MELMIGIVILGLGMVMVATIFPVAWERARTLNEQTIQQSVVANAHATVKSLVRVSSPSSGTVPTADDASSFFGDLVCDPAWPARPISACGQDFASDTWVHALNVENVQLADRRFIREDPWRLEVHPPFTEAYLENDVAPAIRESSFLRQAQVSLPQRVNPPMGRRGSVDAYGVFTGDDDRWDDALAVRRFCWAVFHRMTTPLPGDCHTPQTRGATRSFDLYYVTLRRPRPTFRYARQDFDPSRVPSPCDIEFNYQNGPVIPAARPADEDVMFPVPWRVQVQFPNTLVRERDPVTGELNPDITGIPTEIEVPHPDLADAEARVMLVEMFPVGARFIDEITGDVYGVVKRRVTGANGDRAILTLDREVFVEDIDLPDIVVNGVNAPDRRCESTPCLAGHVDPMEQLRTVWVFPPPVEAEISTSSAPRTSLTFVGSQPVVGIDIRTLNISPLG
jgi:hypothetical protein